MIELIDEIIRGRARLPGGRPFYDKPELHGLAGTVLSAIVRAAHAPTVPQIGRSLGYPRQTIQRQADLLVERGWVRLIENPEHKRARRLIATPEGAELSRQSDLRSHAWAAQFTAGLSPENLAVTVETLRLIRQRLEADARSGAMRRAAGA